jgi:hypothetical protein
VGAELFREDGRAGTHNEANICLLQLFCKHDYKIGNYSTAIYFWQITAQQYTTGKLQHSNILLANPHNHIN